MGLLSHKGGKNAISARFKKLGKSYGLALSSSLKHLSSTKTIDLPGNSLGQKGGGAILSSLTPSVKNINLAHNRLGPRAVNQMINWLTSQPPSKSLLEKINFENNRLCDQSIIDLMTAFLKVQV